MQAMSGSPQSTLCAWAASSNRGSPNGPSVVSSPPTLSTLKQRAKAESPRDLLREAAGQIICLRLDELGRRESLYDRGILGAHRTSPTASAAKKAEARSLAPYPVLSQQQIQAARVSTISSISENDLQKSKVIFALQNSEACLTFFL